MEWVTCAACALKYRRRPEGCPRCGQQLTAELAGMLPSPGEPVPSAASSTARIAGLTALVVFGVVVTGVFGALFRGCATGLDATRRNSLPIAKRQEASPGPTRRDDVLAANSLTLDRNAFIDVCEPKWKDRFQCACTAAALYDEFSTDFRSRFLAGSLTAEEQDRLNVAVSRNCSRPVRLWVQ